MSSDCIYNNLRHKLDVLGYTQPLPLAAISLVGVLFEDLVKTTESLRDSKLKISNLLEEKTCWELGVEPYKCDNSRLLAQCNQLHLELIKQKDDYEEKTCELNHRIRNLESDKNYLDEHCQHLQGQIKAFILKGVDSKTMKTNKNGVNMSKKPFVSTVRSGEFIPNAFCENMSSIKCTKCNAGYYKQSSAGSENAPAGRVEIDRLENSIKDLSDQINFYKRKVEARDREIRRLNDLLTGGRPAPALAKDCCYKDIGTLSEDVELLQREKSESLCKIREFQDKMHEAMQRALDLESKNKKLQRELSELKEAALAVESQANTEIAEREKEIEDLKADLRKLKSKFESKEFSIASSKSSADDKRRINERLNELTQRESELMCENEKLMKKNHKLKTKLNSCQKENVNKGSKEDRCIDEERIRLKSERDFFQKEYLRMISKSGSEKEIEFLQSQIKCKDDELRLLRSELCIRQQQPSARSDKSSSSECVQAIVIRAERERDIVKVELERMRNERDTLREKLQSFTILQAESSQKYQEKIHELNSKITALECENRDLNSARLPSQTQIVVLKEEIESLKRKLFELQEENCKLKASQSQLKLLQDQTERALTEYQNKLTAAEAQLQSAESQLSNYGTHRDTSRNEVSALKSEIASLKSTYVKMESEKDKIVAELDAKTEKVYQLEFDLKATKDKRNDLERQVKELERKLEYQELIGFEGSFGTYLTENFYKELERPEFADIDRAVAKEFFEGYKKTRCGLKATDSLFEVSGTGQLMYSNCEGDSMLNWKDKGFVKLLHVLMKSSESNEMGVLSGKMKLNRKVERITWDPSGKEKILIKIWNGEIIKADHVICTTSLGVLKKVHLQLFSPQLPEPKCKAIEGLQMGTVDKFLLEFDQPFGPNDWSGFCLLWTEKDLKELRSSERFWLESAFGFYRVCYQPRILTGWIFGSHARHMETLPEDEVLEGIMWLLRKFLSFNVPLPKNFLRTQWHSNPNFRGSYSSRSMLTEEMKTGADDLAEPVTTSDGRPVLQFAGEATSPDHFSTVHGAVESGWREARRLITFYSFQE